MPEAEAARPKHAHVPFSSGPRVCIDNHFALMGAPLVLTALLQRADLSLDGVTGEEPDVKATLRPKGGVADARPFAPRLGVVARALRALTGGVRTGRGRARSA